MLQQERAESAGAAAGSKLDILMPTTESTLRSARDCVFNNMTWLPDVETADLNLGSYGLVHQKISHAVAHTCGCRGLSLVYAREATEMQGADWCEAAGQSEPITTRLKNLLKDYPADVSMFKEMVQNADDAGATEVHFVWDWRQHRRQSLLTPDMDRWQGPALWIFNDAQFSSKDFESICRLGVGGKRDQTRKIGRFGLGFNSVYNFTDLPSILSDDMVLFLDPHVHHLSAMGASVQKPGIKLRFLKIKVLEKFRDQFLPYHQLLGCDLSSSRPFPGTLMRVPFRSAEVAKASEVSNIQMDKALAAELTTQFRAEAFQWLLFLQNVARIRLSEIHENMGSEDVTTTICEVKMGIPASLASETGEAEANDTPAAKRISAIGSDCVVADITIDATDASCPGQRSHHYRLIGGADCGVTEQVCIALPLVELPGNQNGNDATGYPKEVATVPLLKLAKEEGRLFCFLPLPKSAISLRLAAHVHAPLNTTQDRRNVLMDERVGERELITKNVRLLDVRIPECVARCVLDLSTRASPQDYFSVFPVLHPSARGGDGRKQEVPESTVADRVAQSFYKLLIRRAEPFFPTVAPSEGMPWSTCVSFSEAVFCSPREAKLSSGGPADQGAALLTAVCQCLARFGVHVVKIPLRVLESFEQVLHPAQPRVLTPAWLRQFLRAVGASKSSFAISEDAKSATLPAPEMRKNAEVSIPSLTTEEATALLDYAIADGDFADLEGVPLLISEDAAVGTVSFSSAPNTAGVFVPEDDDEYQLLPQAPRRVLSKKVRALRPWVWQHLRQIASGDAPPGQKPSGQSGSFQLKRMTVEPLMAALQELLPKGWNVKSPEVSMSEWEDWVETWLRTLWHWLNRMSVPAKNLLHWPLVPSLRPLPIVQGSEGSVSDTQPECKVRLHRLLPDSTLFSASEEQDSRRQDSQQMDRPASGIFSGEHARPLVQLLESRLGCTPVWLPKWLRGDRERQLTGFVHPATADGLMKAAHSRLRLLVREKHAAQVSSRSAAVLELRKLFGSDISKEEQAALAAWLVRASVESCDCPSSTETTDDQTAAVATTSKAKGTEGWRLKCGIVQAAPLFRPFATPTELVALIEFDQAKNRGPDMQKGSSRSNWSLLPEACVEVVAALRVAQVPMAGCVEPATESIAALLRELQMPRLSWAEVLLEHVFPWASNPGVEAATRQGLLLAVVQRWREMELAGNEQCIQALQRVSFISTVEGKICSPAALLDPRKEELRSLYIGETGPFPSAEVRTVLQPLMQRGLLRFRQELSLEELNERLSFLDAFDRSSAGEEATARPGLDTDGKQAPPQDALEWEKVYGCAQSLLQYVAVSVNAKCEEAQKNAAKEAQTEAPKPAPLKAVEDKSRASFFLWPSILPIGEFLSSGGSSPPAEKPGELEKAEDWSERDVETLKCKLRVCRWVPAARAPREWLPAVPWIGNSQKFWRPSEMALMKDFWLCGAAVPVLDLDTQLMLSGERRSSTEASLLMLLGMSSQVPQGQRISCAWSQLSAIRLWWSSRSSDVQEDGASAWVANCLYHHVYPLLGQEKQADATDDGMGEKESGSSQGIQDLFVAGTFVLMEDLSTSQDFGLAGLHQVPKELQGSAPQLCKSIKQNFKAADLVRALRRMADAATDKRPQLKTAETETAVRLAMALSERIRGHGEAVHDTILVPTNQGTLRPSQRCVFNNMRWLSEEEQQKRSRAVTSSGLDWVHQSISNEVAQTLQVQGLSTQVAAEALATADEGEKDPEWFEAAGQQEPLTSRLRSLIRDMLDQASAQDLGFFKALLQNADDATATEINFVWDWRSFGGQSLMSPEMARWQGPCLWAHNNAKFSPQDFENITQLGSMQKSKSQSRKTQIGRFGLGFNSVYSMTDLPSILSDDIVLFLDPHVHHLRGMGASAAKPGIKLRFLKIDVLDKFRDQFEPYHGLFGCDLASSTPYEGTLIRLPFRTPESSKLSEISKTIVSAEQATVYLHAFKEAAAECLLFLQHVKQANFLWIPPDAGPDAVPTPLLQVRIMPSTIPASLGQAGQRQAEVFTDERALEYRRVFSSRSLQKSKEKQSFISDLLSRLGVQQPTESETRPYVSFNVVVSVLWISPTDLQSGKEQTEVLEAWRLFLQHDNPEDDRWKSLGEAEAEGLGYVPFAGLAVCLSRELHGPRICCFLPLPVTSSLPFLINANFCLTDPTAPGRLDLAAGSGFASDWNSMLLRHIVEPLICTLVREQAGAIQAVRGQCPSADAAHWVVGKEGICALMPCKSQLPHSLRKLLNLPSIYKELSSAALFPPLVFARQSSSSASELVESARSFAAQIFHEADLKPSAKLLSFTASVQPLTLLEGRGKQHQAVHEYLSSGKGLKFCEVARSVSEEFKSANSARHAEVNPAFVLSCLREDTRSNLDALTAIELLGYVLSEELPADVVSALQGLKLGPLCSGKVASFNSTGAPLYYAFPTGGSASGSSTLAQQVLQQLVPALTLNLSGVDEDGVARLGASAPGLGIEHVRTSEQLATALIAGFPAIRSPPLEYSSLQAAIEDRLGGPLRSESFRRVTAESLKVFGDENTAQSTLRAFWAFAEVDGLGEDFLSFFERCWLLPAWDPQEATGSAASQLMLLPLSKEEPLLLPPEDGADLAELARVLLPDRFVNASHPAMTPGVLQFLQQQGVLLPFGRGSLLTVLAAWASALEQLGSLSLRCQRLRPQQRHYLCSELCTALCDPIAPSDARTTVENRASVVCRLPIFLAESENREEEQAQAFFRSLVHLAVVEGEPLQLLSPPVRLDLESTFIFLASPKTPAEVATALALPEVKEPLLQQRKYFDSKTWLHQQVLPHLADMVDDDQVRFLERLLPLMENLDEANSEPYLVPAEVPGRLMKPPCTILDPQDFLIQEVFGARGDAWPKLGSHHQFHFPSKALSSTVLSHLRRLGMRKSNSDGRCLGYLCQALREQHKRLPGQRYGEVQRSLMQKIVESWSSFPGPHRDMVLEQEFVDISAEADGGEQPGSLFELRPYRATRSTDQLLKLSSLVSRVSATDPYLCWTSLPLSPRGFPEFEGYRRPMLEDVLSHAHSISALADGAVPPHLWEELKEKVVGQICQFLANSPAFQNLEDIMALDESEELELRSPETIMAHSQRRARICAQLRKVKFLAVPLQSGVACPHTLVAPWRISLVLKEHRPPMFALPAYLSEHVALLRMLGVRDALELPQESQGGTETDISRVADESMTWLFENGADSFSDVTLRCDGGSLFLHRNILMARSDYFRAMFQGESGFRESQEGGAEVSLFEIPLEVAKILFGYLYHGKVDEQPLEGPEGTSNSVDLMCFADQLGVPRLFEFAQLWVANQQDLEDCAEMLKLASRHRATLLERATMALMASNWDSPEVEHQLANLSPEHRLALEERVKQARQQRP